MFDNWRNDQGRELFSSGEADLTQAYFVYVKENRQSMAEKAPPVGALTIFKQALADIKVKNLSQPFMLEDERIWEGDDTAWADLAKIMDAKLRGPFELVDVGCCISYNLIVTGQCRGAVWSFADVGVQPCCEWQNFLGWFELWLDIQDDVDYFKDYIYE